MHYSRVFPVCRGHHRYVGMRMRVMESLVHAHCTQTQFTQTNTAYTHIDTHTYIHKHSVRTHKHSVHTQTHVYTHTLLVQGLPSCLPLPQCLQQQGEQQQQQQQGNVVVHPTAFCTKKVGWRVCIWFLYFDFAQHLRKQA